MTCRPHKNFHLLPQPVGLEIFQVLLCSFPGFEIFRVDDPEKTNFPLEQRFCQNNATKAISTGAYINKREVLHAYRSINFEMSFWYMYIQFSQKTNETI